MLLIDNCYIASLKLLPTKEYESKENYGHAVVTVNHFGCWFFKLQ